VPRQNHLLLVDALNLIRRIDAAQSADSEGSAQGSCESSVRSLRRALRYHEPTHAVVVFDGGGNTWRHQAFANYKANHKPMRESLASALPDFKKAFDSEGVATLERPETEADDVIATLAVKMMEVGRATILSTDKGYLQLLPRGVGLRDHFRNLDLGAHYVRDRFGVSPTQFVELLALAGDSSSSIPGVPGIGIKTAATLLGDGKTLHNVLEAAAEHGEGTTRDPGDPLTPRIAEKLVEHAEDAVLAHKLVTLRTDMELGVNLKDLRLRASAANERPR